jgi:ferredoxin-NADP reductase
MAAGHEVRLLERSQCDDALILRLSRPAGYLFAAGQYLILEIETAGGPQRRTFSHASAPGDPDIEIMTRLSDSEFKQALGDMVPGDAAYVRGPGGRLHLPEAEPVVFLAGGVGITPIRSLIRDAEIRGDDLEAVLLFGNRDDRCIPYRQELDALTLSRTHVVHVLEHPIEPWQGERGFIDPGLISRHVNEPKRWYYMIAGPPPMVEAMGRCVAALGIDPARVTLERFGAPTSG